ncbi:MAG TPA: hypothetical protein VIF09_29755 [Polyangiaceae bacterium]
MRKALLATTLGAVALLSAGDAAADKPWIDRPLTLPPVHFAADVGLGFGQYTTLSVNPSNPSAAPSQSTSLGWGSNLEAAIGLPFLGEFGARVGYRFDQVGANAQADHFGRLFDPILNDPGFDNMTNPELHLRGTLIPLEIFELGLETRAILPTANGSSFGLSPGVPMRIHIPYLARIDTGLFFPIVFNANTSYTIDIPAQLFFQVSDAFFGPFTGVRYNHAGGGTDSTTDIPIGLGGGYTLGGMVDLKVQVRTERVNDANWARGIGGGFGVGLRVP